MPAFSPKKARSFIERELGAPIDVLFKEFEDQPIAAASLGQVFDLCLHVILVCGCILTFCEIYLVLYQALKI